MVKNISLYLSLLTIIISPNLAFGATLDCYGHINKFEFSRSTVINKENGRAKIKSIVDDKGEVGISVLVDKNIIMSVEVLDFSKYIQVISFTSGRDDAKTASVSLNQEGKAISVACEIKQSKN